MNAEFGIALLKGLRRNVAQLELGKLSEGEVAAVLTVVEGLYELEQRFQAPTTSTTSTPTDEPRRRTL
jgi:hypothetical protein